MKRKLAIWITWYMLAVAVLLGIAPRAEAGFSPSEPIRGAEITRSADLGKVQKFLETKMVRERLRDFGFGEEEIQTRINQLTDDQLHQVALQIDELKVGGNGEGVIIVLLILILIVLIIYATGHRILVK
jgi:hypothetical protein